MNINATMEVYAFSAMAVLQLIFWLTLFMQNRRNEKKQAERLELFVRENSLLLQKQTAEQNILFMKLRDMLMLHASCVEIKNGKWVLEKNQISKIFRPGELCEVQDGGTGTKTIYTHAKEEIIADTLLNGKLQCRIILTETGIPKSGNVYDKEGKLLKTFVYDEFGQLKNIR